MRFSALALSLSVAGCQVVAGIDDRSVAPPLDSGTVDSTMQLDTATSPDSGSDATEPDTSLPSDTTVADAPVTEADVFTDADAMDFKVVVNEVRAAGGGSDYAELYNAGTVPADLSGWGLTGTEDSGGFSTPIRFSAGEVLAPGAHLLILAGQVVAPPGPQTACGGPARCYFAAWGISQSRGETLRLMRADDSVADELVYPMNGHADGQTWGRLPDGSATLGVMKPTPSAANAGL